MDRHPREIGRASVSYIAFDLDALNKAPAAARSAGVREEDIIAGLVRMWAWCFREKVEHIEATQLRGHFGAEVGPALVAFGYLEVDGERWRVRGADRYLRISNQRKQAGRARAASAGRAAGKFAGAVPAKRQRQPAADQRAASETPALTPNTDDRAPNTTEREPRPSDLLCEDFKRITGADYRWQGANDGTALADLLKTADVAEVRRRWEHGLRQDPKAWVSCRTVRELLTKWNSLIPSVDLSKPKLRQL